MAEQQGPVSVPLPRLRFTNLSRLKFSDRSAMACLGCHSSRTLSVVATNVSSVMRHTWLSRGYFCKHNTLVHGWDPSRVWLHWVPESKFAISAVKIRLLRKQGNEIPLRSLTPWSRGHFGSVLIEVAFSSQDHPRCLAPPSPSTRFLLHHYTCQLPSQRPDPTVDITRHLPSQNKPGPRQHVNWLEHPHPCPPAAPSSFHPTLHAPHPPLPRPALPTPCPAPPYPLPAPPQPRPRSAYPLPCPAPPPMPLPTNLEQHGAAQLGGDAARVEDASPRVEHQRRVEVVDLLRVQGRRLLLVPAPTDRACQTERVRQIVSGCVRQSVSDRACQTDCVRACQTGRVRQSVSDSACQTERVRQSVSDRVCLTKRVRQSACQTSKTFGVPTYDRSARGVARETDGSEGRNGDWQRKSGDRRTETERIKQERARGETGHGETQSSKEGKEGEV